MSILKDVVRFLQRSYDILGLVVEEIQFAQAKSI